MDAVARVKVVHIITRLDLGGAQRNTLYTCAHLDPQRYECVLISGPGGWLDGEAAQLPEGVRVRWAPALVREIAPARDLLALLQLAALLFEERPAVVHTHSSKAGVLGRLAAALVGVPVVVHTFHGFGFNDYQAPRLKRTFVWAERLCGALSSALVFVSRANQLYAERHRIGRPQRYHLIRSGVRLAGLPAVVADKAAKKAELGFGRHKPLLVSIGNLKPQKNPGDFISLAMAVSAKRPDAEFLFIGDGPLRDRLECQVIASGLSQRFALPGWRRDADQWLAVADVFAMTSLWEGLPRALVEAMRSGLPSVCYATDGITDILRDGDNGFCVPAGDVERMAERVLQLLADERLRREMGRRAAAAIGPEFDIDAMVLRQAELYERLLAGS